MKIKFAPAIIVGALLAIPVAGYAQDTPKRAIQDTAITTKIKAAQALDPTVSAMRIDVNTDNSGRVTLSGNAKSQAEIDRAVQIARGVDGVTSVQNNMTLAAAPAGTTGTTMGTPAGTTSRTTGTPAGTTGTTMGTPAGTTSTTTGMRTDTTTTRVDTTTGARTDATMARAPRTDRN